MELGGLWFDAIAVDGNKGWFSCGEFNGLFRVDLKTGETEYICDFPDEGKKEKRLFTGVEKVGNKLYFAPGTSNSILIYDIQCNCFHRHLLKEVDSERLDAVKLKFMGTVADNENVYFIACGYPAIIKINIITEMIEYITGWVDLVESKSVDNNSIYFRKDVVLKNEELLLASACCDGLVSINLIDGNCGIQTIHGTGLTYLGFGYSEDVFWFMPKDKMFALTMDFTMKELNTVDVIDEKCRNVKAPFFQCIKIFNGRVWFIPAYGDKVVSISENNMKEVEYKLFKTDYLMLYRFHAIWVCGTSLYGLLQPEREVVNLSDENETRFRFVMSEEDYKRNYYKLQTVKNEDGIGNNMSEHFLLESDEMSLLEFIELIK